MTSWYYLNFAKTQKNAKLVYYNKFYTQCYKECHNIPMYYIIQCYYIIHTVHTEDLNRLLMLLQAFLKITLNLKGRVVDFKYKIQGTLYSYTTQLNK